MRYSLVFPGNFKHFLKQILEESLVVILGEEALKVFITEPEGISIKKEFLVE